MIKADMRMTETKEEGEREPGSEDSGDDEEEEGKKKEDLSGKPIYE